MPLMSHSLEGFEPCLAAELRLSRAGGTDRGHAGKSGPCHAICFFAVDVGDRMHDSSRL